MYDGRCPCWCSHCSFFVVGFLIIDVFLPYDVLFSFPPMMTIMIVLSWCLSWWSSHVLTITTHDEDVFWGRCSFLSFSDVDAGPWCDSLFSDESLEPQGLWRWFQLCFHAQRWMRRKFILSSDDVTFSHPSLMTRWLLSTQLYPPSHFDDGFKDVMHTAHWWRQTDDATRPLRWTITMLMPKLMAQMIMAIWCHVLWPIWYWQRWRCQTRCWCHSSKDKIDVWCSDGFAAVDDHAILDGVDQADQMHPDDWCRCSVTLDVNVDASIFVDRCCHRWCCTMTLPGLLLVSWCLCLPLAAFDEVDVGRMKGSDEPLCLTSDVAVSQKLDGRWDGQEVGAADAAVVQEMVLSKSLRWCCLIDEGWRRTLKRTRCPRVLADVGHVLHDVFELLVRMRWSRKSHQSIWWDEACRLQLQMSKDVVRKHSPGRSPQSCPSGNFSPFSAEMVQNDFRRFARSRIAFAEKLRNTPSIIFSDLLESALHLEIGSIHKVFRERCFGRKNVQKNFVLREQHEMKFWQCRSEFWNELTQKNALIGFLNPISTKFWRSTDGFLTCPQTESFILWRVQVDVCWEVVQKHSPRRCCQWALRTISALPTQIQAFWVFFGHLKVEKRTSRKMGNTPLQRWERVLSHPLPWNSVKRRHKCDAWALGFPLMRCNAWSTMQKLMALSGDWKRCGWWWTYGIDSSMPSKMMLSVLMNLP